MLRAKQPRVDATVAEPDPVRDPDRPPPEHPEEAKTEPVVVPAYFERFHNLVGRINVAHPNSEDVVEFSKTSDPYFRPRFGTEPKPRPTDSDRETAQTKLTSASPKTKETFLRSSGDSKKEESSTQKGKGSNPSDGRVSGPSRSQRRKHNKRQKKLLSTTLP
jgi:hypothetical protein